MRRKTHEAQFQDPLKYMRRRGNRRVRAQRRRRSAIRAGLLGAFWAGAVIAVTASTVMGARWAIRPGNFPLETVIIRGHQEARVEELQSLLDEWRGENVLNISLKAVEARIREHPWIGSTGSVRIGRRLPDGLAITVAERRASALALVDGFIVLIDEHGAPIDRFGQRYASHEFPIVTGVDPLVRHARRGDGGPMKTALRTGVEVTRILSEWRPDLYRRVSEIDVSDPAMVVLRLEDETYELRLSREEYLRNMGHYITLKERLDAAEGSIDYVDLRWKDRIAVSPAAALLEVGGE